MEKNVVKSKKKRKNKLNTFGKFLAIYSGIFAVVIVVLLILLHGLLKDYEEGIPDTAMDSVIEKFNSEGIGELVTKDNCGVSEFETTDYVVEQIKTLLEGKNVSYKRKAGEYTNNNPVYNIYADENLIAKVSLASDGLNGHKFNIWKIGNIDFSGTVRNDNVVKITAPSNAAVKINGVEVSDSYTTQNDIPVTECANVGAYTTVATNKVIEVKGLMAKPVVTASLDGNELAVSETDTGVMISYPSDESIVSTITDKALLIGQNYGKYIINRGNLATLLSYMVGNAKVLMSDIPAVWAYMYGTQFTYEFKNEQVSDFIKYSDTCVSCKIHFDLIVRWSGGEKVYDTNMIYTFVYTGGDWFLGDFSIQ